MKGNTMTTLPTQNKQWGFWGTAKNYLDDKSKMQALWEEAFTIIQKNAGFTPLETVALLDSRWGRHIADEHAQEISAECFGKTFKRKMTKERLYKSYNYYVDPNAYRMVDVNKNAMFCKELTALSKKYGIVIQAVGGVHHTAKGFIKYNSDLDCGDLMPEWKD